jgi:hypothetical protein
MPESRPARRAGRLVVAIAVLSIGGALAAVVARNRPTSPDAPSAGATSRMGGGGGADAQALGAIVSRGEPIPGYWTLPVPPQGAAASGLSPREASLKPDACGSCHPVQLAGWQASLHARAMSPGLRGQLVDLLETDPASALDCLTCHAPLEEQRPLVARADGEFEPNPRFRESLLSDGITCAACHVREHRRFGPPALPDNPNTRYPPGTPDHGGVTRSPAFGRAEFCAACHQFDQSAAVNGKPLQNTYVEWRASEWGQRGVACQVCHMPGRQHLWKGIHDRDMVRQALVAELSLDAPGTAREPVRARLRVTNQGAGHHLPTYVTPTIVLRVIQLDRAGRPLAGTAREARLRRDVAFEGGAWVERSDTRLPAGATTELAYEVSRHPKARALRAAIDVLPDDFYVRDVYPGLLAAGAASEEARPLIRQALEEGRASRFTAWETTARLPLTP